VANVEITQEQLDALNRSAALLQQMSTNPETKRDFERVVKKIVPSVETTDDIVQAAAKPYIDQLESVTTEFRDYVAAQKEREEAAAANRADGELATTFGEMRANGLTDKGEDAVRQLMVDRNIADPHAALALFEKQNPAPPQGVSSWEPDSWNISANAVDRDIEGLFKNPDTWGDIEAGNVLAELRRNAA
jgi:hypothetical protein